MSRGSVGGYAPSLRLSDGSCRHHQTIAPTDITSASVQDSSGSRTARRVNKPAGVRPAAPPWLGLLPCALLPGLALWAHHPTPQHFTLRLVVRGYRTPPHSSTHCYRLARRGGAPLLLLRRPCSRPDGRRPAEGRPRGPPPRGFGLAGSPAPLFSPYHAPTGLRVVAPPARFSLGSAEGSSWRVGGFLPPAPGGLGAGSTGRLMPHAAGGASALPWVALAPAPSAACRGSLQASAPTCRRYVTRGRPLAAPSSLRFGSTGLQPGATSSLSRPPVARVRCRVRSRHFPTPRLPHPPTIFPIS